MSVWVLAVFLVCMSILVRVLARFSAKRGGREGSQNGVVFCNGFHFDVVMICRILGPGEFL